MTKRKVIRRYDRPPLNYYSLGGLATGIGQVGGNLIGGGLESGAGNAISKVGGTIGSAISAVNPLIGGIVSIGSGLIGGLTNRMFGSKLNKENIAKIEGETGRAAAFTSDASSFDSLSDNWMNSPVIAAFDKSTVGKDGWFSNKAKKKYRELQKKADAANQWVDASLTNNAENIKNNTMDMLEANWAAYGGPLFGSGAIGYELANKRLYNQELSALGRNKITSMPNSFPAIDTFALGGPMGTHGADWTNGLVFINEGGTHESNPYEGVPMGTDAQGTPNLVEEGEVVWNDYVFSNRLKVPKAAKERLKIKKKDSLTFAEAATILSKESSERPNDPISQAGLEASMGGLMAYQEEIRMKKGKTKNKFPFGGPFITGDPDLDFRLNMDRKLNEMKNFKLEAPSLIDNRTPAEKYTDMLRKNGVLPEFKVNAPSVKSAQPDTTDKGTNPATLLRYAPVVGSGLMAFSDAMGWTNKPDYSNADRIGRAVEGLPNVRFSPIGNYLAYSPLDREFYLNSLRSQQGATRRAIANTSGGNRANAMAGLLAADFAAGNQFGAFARQAEEQNFARRQAVENFNRATNMYNSEGFMKADIANQGNSKLGLQAALAQAEMREQIDARSGAARSANLSNFITSLGNIGREEVMKSWINENPALYYAISTGGAGTPYKKTQKYGGCLTIKRRK